MSSLTNYHIKLIAAASMLIDHVGALFYPDIAAFRIIGRISFPLFAWLLVQGEAHTSHIKRYGLRLGLLGVLSQPIYSRVFGMFFGIPRFNILFQLLIGLLCLRLSRAAPRWQVVIWIVGLVAAEALSISYGSYGILVILLLRYRDQMRSQAIWWLAWIGFHGLWAIVQSPNQLPAAAAPLILLAANEQRGAKARWFYGFYPGHLALLGLLQTSGL